MIERFLPGSNYPRRQRYRRLSRAASAATGSAATVLLALLVASAGELSAGGLLLIAAFGLAFYARHWFMLAGRSRVGARSEDEVRAALAPLGREGWRLGHSLVWQRRGDIDSLAIAPTGIGFAIETKTLRYEPAHVLRVREQAAWLAQRRRRWCRRGSVAVICLARAHRIRYWEADVLVVSADWLLSTLREVACVGADGIKVVA